MSTRKEEIDVKVTIDEKVLEEIVQKRIGRIASNILAEILPGMLNNMFNGDYHSKLHEAFDKAMTTEISERVNEEWMRNDLNFIKDEYRENMTTILKSYNERVDEIIELKHRIEVLEIGVKRI